VQQALGIGLGFNFDHMRLLKKDEKPSSRKLQARAAKSAIRRVQELYDVQALNNQVDTISDPEKKKKKKAELREMTKTEIKYIGKRLSQLIPTANFDDIDEIQIQQFKQTKFRKTGSNEYVMTGGPPPQFSSSAIDLLRNKYGPGSENTATDTTSSYYDIIVENSNDADGAGKAAAESNSVAKTAIETTTSLDDVDVLNDHSGGDDGVASETQPLDKDAVIESGFGDDEFVETFLRQKRDDDDDEDGTKIVLA
jgi:hypothetical protein